MKKNTHILFTGGSGLLGREFQKLRPDILYPSSFDFNICDYEQMVAYAHDCQLSTVIHAAAFTSPPKVDDDPMKALETNIIGTANVVRFCKAFRSRLVYISTDYVFKGDRGAYTEEDSVYPVNLYAWSKLGGECAVRMYDNSLIIRTSFGPNIFPYDKAFIDQWTSRESVRTVARKIAALIDVTCSGVVHVGGVRKTVFEYAQELDPSRKITQTSISKMPFVVPIDTSLDCGKFESIMRKDGTT